MSGYLASTQTKIDLHDEANFELSKEELAEAVKLSGYTTKDKEHFSKEVNEKKLSSTQRMWACALMGVWKTMVDVDGWKLPATFNKYNICGKGFFKRCREDNFVRKYVYHCGRLGCEVCAKRAGARASKKIEKRIWLYGLRIQKISKGRRNPLPSHIIEAVDAKDDFWKLPKEKQTTLLKKIRKEVGLIGGAEINHLWAFDKSDLKPFFRPHKHLIAYGWLRSDAHEIIKEKFGINMVYHKVAGGTLRTRLDVFAVAFYQLSHTAVKHDKHSIKWFGELSYRKISNKTLEKFKDQEYLDQDNEIEKTKSCDCCHERLIPAKIDDKLRDWRERMPPPDELEKGCVFSHGLFISVDFFKGDKMPYYNEEFEEDYKLKKSEAEELKKLAKPELYFKKTTNQKLTCFIQ